MDRLSALIVGLALVACESNSQQPAPGRVNAAKVEAQKGATVEDFCDVHFAGDSGPKLTVPPLVGGTLAGSSPRWRWINIWATWCKPCIAEMPRLAKWREQLGAAGKPFDLEFVSVDESDADLAEHRKAHPDAPASPRLADPSKQHQWYAALGLDGSPPIPIHVVVAPSGHVRCARAGGVREQDYAAIEKLLSQ